MKVCHMTSAHGEEDVRIFHKECVSLAKAGYEVYLVERGESYDKNGVHIVGVGYIPKSRRKRMTEGAKRVYQKALELDCDIYHFHDPELLPYGLKLKKRGKKVVFDSHENYFKQIAHKYYLPRWAAKMIAKAYHIYETLAVCRIDGVVFPCAIDGKHPFAGKCKRFVFLNNVPLLSELPQMTVASKNAFSVGYVGPIRSDRGNTQNVLAANIAKVPIVFGGTPSSAKYEESLKALDKGCFVEFRGQLDRLGVWQLLSDISVGLVTELSVGQNNTTDNLPTKAYEYMAAGLPVLISCYPYVSRLLEQYSFGIAIDPEDINAQAEAISFLKNNPEEARRMGENGRRAVEQEFNWGVEEKKLLKLYEELENNE